MSKSLRRRNNIYRIFSLIDVYFMYEVCKFFYVLTIGNRIRRRDHINWTFWCKLLSNVQTICNMNEMVDERKQFSLSKMKFNVYDVKKWVKCDSRRIYAFVVCCALALSCSYESQINSKMFSAAETSLSLQWEESKETRTFLFQHSPLTQQHCYRSNFHAIHFQLLALFASNSPLTEWKTYFTISKSILENHSFNPTSPPSQWLLASEWTLEFSPISLF